MNLCTEIVIIAFTAKIQMQQRVGPRDFAATGKLQELRTLGYKNVLKLYKKHSYKKPCYTEKSYII